MKFFPLLCMLGFIFLLGCKSDTQQPADTAPTEQKVADDFVWSTEKFADLQMIRYQVPGYERLTVKQKELVYYLTQAGLAGRDMMWDQNYRYNLTIRGALEEVIRKFTGDKTTEDWKQLILYTKRVWFSNGIHHHYSRDKFNPGFSRAYFQGLLNAVGYTVSTEVLNAMFDPNIDPKKVDQTKGKDIVLNSAVNFYGPDITEQEAIDYYKTIIDTNDIEPISYGLNTKLMRKPEGTLEEWTYKIDGLYSSAIREVVMWLEKAVVVAENEAQQNALKLLVEYYKTGDLKKWDEYNVAWLNATEGDVDYINGFIEVYEDPLGYKATYESVIQIKDFEASERMEKVASSAKWFEENSPIMDAHKKDNVVGISYKVVSVVGLAGDMSPSSAIGVNLPNALWIRAKHGSKSVSLGNIIAAYANASGPGLTNEFAHDKEEMERSEKHNALAGKIHTALHEVIGHASGRLEEGVGTPKETLKVYASPLEEARADLVALHYIMDPKLIEMGIMPSLEVAKAEYDSYIRNGLMLQLRRIVPGNNIEQAHMRNRQTVASWVYEKGKAENVIAKVTRNGKTYFDITDYDKLRGLFSQLLREVQRITSQGDYEAGRDLIENYGVIVDKDIHAEVLTRSEKLDIPPYGGFINPRLVPVTNGAGQVIDVKLEFPDDFTAQMLEYSENYGFLPNYN